MLSLNVLVHLKVTDAFVPACDGQLVDLVNVLISEMPVQADSVRISEDL